MEINGGFMYKMMVIIFLSWISLSWATDHYVDKYASGGNNGTSWSDAWPSFAAIEWGLLNPGDFLYISGGADSLLYYELLHIPAIKGTEANNITIIAGKYAPNPSGHSGRVIIDGSGNGIRPTLGQSILIGGVAGTVEYVTVKGFECRRGHYGIRNNEWTNCVTIDSNY